MADRLSFSSDSFIFIPRVEIRRNPFEYHILPITCAWKRTGNSTFFHALISNPFQTNFKANNSKSTRTYKLIENLLLTLTECKIFSEIFPTKVLE